ncbi:MAG TPA: hypothetical protein VF756_09250 [Thermoanaerobaculia bacterium]
MSRTHCARIVVVLLVAAALAAPPAWSQPMEEQDGFARISNAFGNLFTYFWEEVGCIIDPHGGCSVDEEETPTGDIGCGLDPHGCTDDSGETTEGDIGCIADPHGGCGG